MAKTEMVLPFTGTTVILLGMENSGPMELKIVGDMELVRDIIRLILKKSPEFIVNSYNKTEQKILQSLLTK